MYTKHSDYIRKINVFYDKNLEYNGKCKEYEDEADLMKTDIKEVIKL